MALTSIALVALALTAVSQSPASGSHRNVTAVKGSAFGIHSFNISLFGGPQADVGPRPAVTLAPNASNSPQTATESDLLVQFGPARVFSAAGGTVGTSGSLGPAGSVTSTSDVQDLNVSRTEIFGEDNQDCCIPVGQDEAGNLYNRLAPPDNSGIAPQPARPLTDVASTCTASESGVTGSTTITNGWLYLDNGWADSDTIYPEPAEPPGPEGGIQLPEHDPVKLLVPTNPAPNTTQGGHLHIARNHQDDYVMVFNEQIQHPDGSLTVNALHYYFGYVLQNGQPVPNTTAILRGELIVGQSVCGVTLDGSTSTSATIVSTTTLEPGDSFTASATGVASASSSYVLRMGTTAANCPTGLALGGQRNSDASFNISGTQRIIPTNSTSGARWLCWVRVGDPSNRSTPVQVTIV
ncbi:MAG: hypothetical protein LC733_11140 [Actinobacteria bacterium]|nr:hypothetical protein [Actinomycetota bacterium]